MPHWVLHNFVEAIESDSDKKIIPNFSFIENTTFEDFAGMSDTNLKKYLVLPVTAA